MKKNDMVRMVASATTRRKTSYNATENALRDIAGHRGVTIPKKLPRSWVRLAGQYLDKHPILVSPIGGDGSVVGGYATIKGRGR